MCKVTGTVKSGEKIISDGTQSGTLIERTKKQLLESKQQPQKKDQIEVPEGIVQKTRELFEGMRLENLNQQNLNNTTGLLKRMTGIEHEVNDIDEVHEIETESLEHQVNNQENNTEGSVKKLSGLPKQNIIPEPPSINPEHIIVSEHTFEEPVKKTNLLSSQESESVPEQSENTVAFNYNMPVKDAVPILEKMAISNPKEASEILNKMAISHISKGYIILNNMEPANAASLLNEMANSYPIKAAEILNIIAISNKGKEFASFILNLINDPKDAAIILNEMDSEKASNVLVKIKSFNPEKAVQILKEMNSDKAADILNKMNTSFPGKVAEILNNSEIESGKVEEILNNMDKMNPGIKPLIRYEMKLKKESKRLAEMEDPKEAAEILNRSHPNTAAVTLNVIAGTYPKEAAKILIEMGKMDPRKPAEILNNSKMETGIASVILNLIARPNEEKAAVILREIYEKDHRKPAKILVNMVDYKIVSLILNKFYDVKAAYILKQMDKLEHGKAVRILNEIAVSNTVKATIYLNLIAESNTVKEAEILKEMGTKHAAEILNLIADPSKEKVVRIINVISDTNIVKAVEILKEMDCSDAAKILSHRAMDDGKAAEILEKINGKNEELASLIRNELRYLGFKI